MRNALESFPRLLMRQCVNAATILSYGPTTKHKEYKYACDFGNNSFIWPTTKTKGM